MRTQVGIPSTYKASSRFTKRPCFKEIKGNNGIGHLMTSSEFLRLTHGHTLTDACHTHMTVIIVNKSVGRLCSTSLLSEVLRGHPGGSV